MYGQPVPGCGGKTAAEIFTAAGCVPPASPSCAACLGGPKDTFARMNGAEVCVSTTNRCACCPGLFVLKLTWDGLQQYHASAV